jgi:hypothetical protein
MGTLSDEATPKIERQYSCGRFVGARRCTGILLLSHRYGNCLRKRARHPAWDKGDGADKAFLELLGSEKILDEKKEKRAEDGHEKKEWITPVLPGTAPRRAFCLHPNLPLNRSYATAEIPSAGSCPLSLPCPATSARARGKQCG